MTNPCQDLVPRKMSINGFWGRQYNIVKIILEGVLYQNDRLHTDVYLPLLHIPRNDRKDFFFLEKEFVCVCARESQRERGRES